MPYNFLKLFFVLALLCLPWVIDHIKDDGYRKMVLYCFDDIPGKMGSLNQFLPDAYKLHTKETGDISSLFQAYRSWLLTRFMERDLKSILFDYHRYLALKNRKLYHPDQLTLYFGSTKERLFFLETIDYFLKDCDRQEKIGAHKIYNLGRTQEEDTLTGIGIIAYKIMLAAQLVREKIGVSPCTEGFEKMLDKSLPLKGGAAHT